MVDTVQLYNVVNNKKLAIRLAMEIQKYCEAVSISHVTDLRRLFACLDLFTRDLEQHMDSSLF